MTTLTNKKEYIAEGLQMYFWSKQEVWRRMEEREELLGRELNGKERYAIRLSFDAERDAAVYHYVNRVKELAESRTKVRIHLSPGFSLVGYFVSGDFIGKRTGINETMFQTSRQRSSYKVIPTDLITYIEFL